MEKKYKTITYDYICIGLGPFNLSLACLANPLKDIKGRLLEQRSEFNWHPGMLINGTTLQNPFLADLVSMADPTSPFSYLNYCKQQGRLYQFYIRENFYLNRTEYNRYCRWAIEQLDNIDFQHKVENIIYHDSESTYQVCGIQTLTDGSTKEFNLFTKKLIIGVGSLPQFPTSIESKIKQLISQKCDETSKTLIHSSQYLTCKSYLQRCDEITIIGSGQSGAEVFLDLLSEGEQNNYKLNWVTRSQRYFEMETAKLTLELITPDYAEYFFDLPPNIKKQVLQDHKSLYQGINASLINEIYAALDDNYHSQHCEAQLLPNIEIFDIHYNAETKKYQLHFRHKQSQAEYLHQTDGIVFASGYAPTQANFIDGIKSRIQWDKKGEYQPNRNWSVDINNNEIFIQNAGLQGHGITNPDIGMVCYRNSRIIHAITGIDYYPAEKNTSFQQHQPNKANGFQLISDHHHSSKEKNNRQNPQQITGGETA